MIADDPNGSDYINLDGDFIPDGVKRAVRQSAFQFVERDFCEIPVDPESGNLLPDFMCDIRNHVPVISDRLKRVFDSLDIRYLFYQRLRVVDKKSGLSERYWLAIPPRIDCLQREKSVIDPLWNRATKIVIDIEKIGNYDIFKTAGVSNQEIIVTKRLKEAVERAGAVCGLFFAEDSNLK